MRYLQFSTISESVRVLVLVGSLLLTPLLSPAAYNFKVDEVTAPSFVREGMHVDIKVSYLACQRHEFRFDEPIAGRSRSGVPNRRLFVYIRDITPGHTAQERCPPEKWTHFIETWKDVDLERMGLSWTQNSGDRVSFLGWDPDLRLRSRDLVTTAIPTLYREEVELKKASDLAVQRAGQEVAPSTGIVSHLFQPSPVSSPATMGVDGIEGTPVGREENGVQVFRVDPPPTIEPVEPPPSLNGEKTSVQPISPSVPTAAQAGAPSPLPAVPVKSTPVKKPSAQGSSVPSSDSKTTSVKGPAQGSGREGDVNLNEIVVNGTIPANRLICVNRPSANQVYVNGPSAVAHQTVSVDGVGTTICSSVDQNGKIGLSDFSPKDREALIQAARDPSLRVSATGISGSHFHQSFGSDDLATHLGTE